jgi:hypothetical protein
MNMPHSTLYVERDKRLSKSFDAVLHIFW